MKVTKNITIDLNNPRRQVVHLMAGDNQREITLTLLKDGMPFDVSEGIGTATLVKGVGYIKANGVPGYYDWTSTDEAAVALVTNTTNKWTVRLDEHATDVPGFAQIFVKFSLASGETLYAFPITIDVIRTSGGTTDPDSPWYHSSSFILAGAQAQKTGAMTQPIGIDSDGKLWVEAATDAGLSDEAKIAILECFQNTAWEGTDGIDYYNRLYSALFGTRTLDSITAVYTQTDLVLTTDTLESLRKNLVVTAHYSNGGDYVVSLYELSGTLTKGESTITAIYAGKSTTFTVNVTLNTAPVITRTDAFLGYVNGSYEDMPKAGCGITEMYTMAEATTSLYPAGILPARSLSQMKSGNYNACLIIYNENGAPITYLTEVSSSFNRWLQNATGTMTEYKNEWTVGAFKKIAFSVDMNYLDRAYMYDYNTGRVFFAGRNTPYWGMENVSEAGGD